MWIDLVERFGIPMALVVFFVVQAWVREKRIAERLTEIETFERETLLALVARVQQTVTEAVQAVRDNTILLRRVDRALSNGTTHAEIRDDQ